MAFSLHGVHVPHRKNTQDKPVARMEAPKTVVFQPENADGQHGAKTLWWESDTCEEFWLSLLFFLKDFK